MKVPSGSPQELATQISSGAVSNDPWFYLLVAAITFVAGAAGAYLASYFKKRGEAAATKADFQSMIGQLESSTRAVEGVRAEINAQHGAAASAREVLRDRAEQIVMATFDFDLWLEQARSRALRGETSDFNGSPINKIAALTSLYFPEASREFAQLHVAYLAQTQWILELQEASLQYSENPNRVADIAGTFDNVHRPVLAALSALRERIIATLQQRAAL